MRKTPSGYFKGPRYVGRKPQASDVLTGVIIAPPADDPEKIRSEVQAFIAQNKSERTLAEQAEINERIADLAQKIAFDPKKAHVHR